MLGPSEEIPFSPLIPLIEMHSNPLLSPSAAPGRKKNRINSAIGSVSGLLFKAPIGNMCKRAKRVSRHIANFNLVYTKPSVLRSL
jgi:hypothetical protein